MTLAQEKPATSRGDRIGIAVVGVAALVVALVALVATAIAVIQQLGAATVTIDAPAHAAYAALEHRAGVVSATTTRVDVALRDAPAGPRMAIAVGIALQGLTVVVIALAVALLARDVRRGRPFRRTITGLAWTVAFALILGPVPGQFLVIGGGDAALGNLVGEGTGLVHAGEVSFAPWAAAFAVLVIGYAFAIGTRMQRDTDGLV